MTPTPSPAPARYRLIATAGHVDHGKSTLVRTLSGVDPDRLQEEKERGLTIDLGFASFELPSGAVLGVVDVPGHARFLKNMVAGVGPVDACLFVVAAPEGWRTQSAEHLAVLELLGVDRGVVALTKVDQVDDERLAAVSSEVRERLQKSSLAPVRVVPLDALSGRGIPELLDALEELVDSTEPPADLGRPRLFIDRAFSIRGAGAVVTGTLTGGSLAVGDSLAVSPGSAPSYAPRPVRVRRLQVHGSDRETVRPGERVAANLAGVEVTELERGQVLCDPTQWEPTRLFDVSLQLLESAAPLSSRGNRHFHIGTVHQSVSLRLLQAQEIPSGGRGLARVRVEVPLVLLPGDRFLLRDGGRAETIGGGEVLDVQPVLPPKAARPDRSVERVVAERGFVDTCLLERLTGTSRPPDVGRFVVDPSERTRRVTALRARIEAAGPLGVQAVELDALDRALADSLDGVVLRAGHYRCDDASGLDDHPYLTASRQSPLSPPAVDGFSRAELRDLARRGALVDCEGLFFLPEALELAKTALAEELAAEEAAVTVSAFRQRLETSRRVALSLLAHFDQTGVTRRRGDARVAGPALQRAMGLPDTEEKT